MYTLYIDFHFRHKISTRNKITSTLFPVTTAGLIKYHGGPRRLPLSEFLSQSCPASTYIDRVQLVECQFLTSLLNNRRINGSIVFSQNSGGRREAESFRVILT